MCIKNGGDIFMMKEVYHGSSNIIELCRDRVEIYYAEEVV